LMDLLQPLVLLWGYGCWFGTVFHGRVLVGHVVLSERCDFGSNSQFTHP